MSDQPTSLPDREAPSALAIAGSCAGLLALGVAQPILDLVGRSPEFFLARGAPPSDIVALALILGFGIPMVVGGLVAAINRKSPRVGRIVHTVILTVLGSVLALQVTNRLLADQVAGWSHVVLASVVGLVLAYSFYSWTPVRTLLTITAIAVVAVPVTFLFLSPTSAIVFGSGRGLEVSSERVSNPAPVVVVVFDEMPVASLMNSDGDIQEHLYPNFARLAKDGTWFRNAITVQRLTQFSVPAMLTGVNPEQDFVATPIDYPNSIFSLLGGSYEMEALEIVTDLCPSPACADHGVERVSTRERWTTTLDDVAIVAAHLLVPEDLAGDLPPIGENWAGFAEQQDERREQLADNTEFRRLIREQVEAGRGATFERFIESIAEPGNRPTLHFAHVLLPHAVWHYLPTGQRYVPPSPLPGTEDNTWVDDEWLVNQAYQLHLVQTMYVDHLVGVLIDHLEEIGIYDDVVLVVAADHGIAFRAGTENRRAATPESVGDVAAVPLFIKAPGLSPGIDDYRAETFDVLPTIAEALGVEVPWDTDGSSLIGDDRPDRKESVITGGGTVAFGIDGGEKLEIARHKIDVFGEDGPFHLTPDGARDFLGLSLDDLTTRPAISESAEVTNLESFADVETSGDLLPAVVQGLFVANSDDRDNQILAIGVNGTIAALTRTYVNDEGNSAFYALLPPDSLRDGRNEIEVLRLDQGEQGRPLFVDIGP